MFVTWMDNGDGTMTFEVQSIDPHMSDQEVDASVHYISVAYSRDPEYSDDTSIMCSLGFEPTTRLYQAVSWLPVYVGDDEGLETVLVNNNVFFLNRMDYITKQIKLLSQIEGGIGFVYASFIRPVSITYDAPTTEGSPVEEVNDLSAEPFYIMTAFGPLNPLGGIGEDVMAAASQESYWFIESDQTGETSEGTDDPMTSEPMTRESTTITTEGPMTTILSPSYIMEGCGETKSCWGHYGAEDRDCDWDNEVCQRKIV